MLTGFAVLLSLSGWRMSFTIANLYGMTILSGFIGMTTSVGAPPLPALYADRPARTSRATLSAFFAFGALLSLAGPFALGMAGGAELLHAGFMPAPMLSRVAAAAKVKTAHRRAIAASAMLRIGGLAS